MLPTKTEVTAHVNKVIAELKEFAKTELDINVDALRPNISFKICQRYGSGGHRGFVPVMKLNLGYVITYPVLGVHEYRSYAHDPRIGGFHTTDWRIWVETLVYHEFAHVVQFQLIHKHRVGFIGSTVYVPNFGYSDNGHGPFFQRIYAKIRGKFLNHRISPLYRNPAKEWDIPQDVINAELAARAKKRAAKISTDHPLMGIKVKYGGRIYELREYKASNHKYPLIGVAACGARLKMPEDFALANKIN